MSNCFKCSHLKLGKCAIIGYEPTCYTCEEECGDFEARADDADSDLSTLERLLRCPCGGWLEVDELDGCWWVQCDRCHAEVCWLASPPEAVMAFHREHGGKK